MDLQAIEARLEAATQGPWDEADLESREKEQTMSEDYTPSMDDIAEYYTACRMRGYDEVQGGEPYAIVRARCKEGFNHVIAAHDKELREQIAQEIEVHMRHHDNAQIGFSAVGYAYADAARIARGKAS